MNITCACGAEYATTQDPCPDGLVGCLVLHTNRESYRCAKCGTDNVPDHSPGVFTEIGVGAVNMKGIMALEMFTTTSASDTQESTTEVHVGDIWYRAIVYKHDSSVHYEKWYVHAVTPKGLWVGRYRLDVCFTPLSHKESGREWYTFSTRKISRTKEEALQRLIARTAFWVKKARQRLEQAEARYRMLTGGEYKEAPLLRTCRSHYYPYED